MIPGVRWFFWYASLGCITILDRLNFQKTFSISRTNFFLFSSFPEVARERERERERKVSEIRANFVLLVTTPVLLIGSRWPETRPLFHSRWESKIEGGNFFLTCCCHSCNLNTPSINQDGLQMNKREPVDPS